MVGWKGLEPSHLAALDPKCDEQKQKPSDLSNIKSLIQFLRKM